MRRTLMVIVALCGILGASCGRRDPSSGSMAGGSITAPSTAMSNFRGNAITFPPRNEPFDFRVQLEAKYRDGLRRTAGPTFVNNEGDIVWTQEYLRYRVNSCNHVQAVQRVLAQIDTGVIAPECGTAPSGTVLFPPRNEPFDFRQQLEAKYRDGLRRTAESSYVDIEGSIVWTQEYLRYRLNSCDHTQGVLRVFQQIDTGAIQPVCGAPPPDPRPEPPRAPVARPGGPYGPVNSGTNITFNGLGSSATSPAQISKYIWTCGQSGNTACSKEGPTPVFNYTKPPGTLGTTSTYTVTLIVEDNRGGRSSPATTTVRVSNVYSQ